MCVCVRARVSGLVSVWACACEWVRLMIAFITWNSNLVPLFEGLCSSNQSRFEFSGFAGVEPTISELTIPRSDQRNEFYIILHNVCVCVCVSVCGRVYVHVCVCVYMRVRE